MAVVATFVPAPRAVTALGAAVHPVSPAPAPATRADAGSGSGTGPSNDPTTNIAPSPNFLASCAGNSYDNSPACQNAVLGAIDNARNLEGLPGLVLPTDWYSLTPQEQLFIATNLERTVRGLPALSGMATALDGAALGRRRAERDPPRRRASRGRQWGGNWAGAVGNPLEAIYFWMYDDGLGSNNIDCSQAGTPGLLGAPRQHLAEPALRALSRWAPASTPPATRATRAGPSSWSTRREPGPRLQLEPRSAPTAR